MRVEPGTLPHWNLGKIYLKTEDDNVDFQLGSCSNNVESF